MTAIVGLASNGRVTIGGDSAGLSGWDLTIRRDPKVFASGPYVFGFTSSFRMGQLIRWTFNPPAPETGDLDRFMATTWVDALRICLKNGGWATKENEREEGGVFLVGILGRLFRVESDFQIAESANDYDAVGCGDNQALGALFATIGSAISANKRVKLALAAAERHSAGVRRPFVLVEEPTDPRAAK